jgi:hypothetical protein
VLINLCRSVRDHEILFGEKHFNHICSAGGTLAESAIAIDDVAGLRGDLVPNTAAKTPSLLHMH